MNINEELLVGRRTQQITRSEMSDIQVAFYQNWLDATTSAKSESVKRRISKYKVSSVAPAL